MDSTATKKIQNLEESNEKLRTDLRELTESHKSLLRIVMELDRAHNALAAAVTGMVEKKPIIQGING